MTHPQALLEILHGCFKLDALLQTDEKHKREKFVLSVAYSPDGKRLACGVMDGTVPSGKLMHFLTGHHKPVRDVCFTPGQKLMSFISAAFHALSCLMQLWHCVGMFVQFGCPDIE